MGQHNRQTKPCFPGLPELPGWAERDSFSARVSMRFTTLLAGRVSMLLALLPTPLPVRLLATFLAMLLNGAQLMGAEDPASQQREAAYRAKVAPLIERYCFDCHGRGATEGDLDLDRFDSAQAIRRGRTVWKKVMQKVQVKAMPPSDSPQLSDAARTELLSWLDEALNKVDCVREAEPGRVTLRRLNRVEYRNTIRDLVGIDYALASEFPADDVGYGFDNIGDVLSLPPILLEKYLTAAEEITAAALVTEPPGPKTVLKREGRLMSGGRPAARNGSILVTTDNMHTAWEVKEPGKYRVQIEAYGHQAGPDKVRMGLAVDSEPKAKFEVAATEKTPQVYSTEVRVSAGEHRIAIAFLNDYYKADAPAGERDRNLIVLGIEIQGPLDVVKKFPATHERIFFVKPSENLSESDAARQILTRFSSRAFRRPATADELERLLRFFRQGRESGDSFEQSIERAVQAVLISPSFLFRVEEDPAAGQTERLLNEYELASRLSYFLWSTMPDDELLNGAFRGKLRTGDELQRQVARMLRDAKAQALVDNFAEQWLNLRKYDQLAPSPEQFPEFTTALRQDMRTETTQFFAYVMREDRSLLELLSADYTFLNERLARHYGIAGVKGDEFRQVSLRGTPRGGLLTQGSILTLTSNPTRTSPVKRGKWILENLLGEPPPPPPPNVPELEDQKEQLSGTLRQQLEQHRKNPNCAVCHQQMDELGFALENFNAIGGWRTFDGNLPIDAVATLPSGERFDGPRQLVNVLIEKKRDQFIRTLTENLLTFALGRGLEYYDVCAVDKIVANLPKQDYRFSALVLEIVRSEPFQKRGAAN